MMQTLRMYCVLPLLVTTFGLTLAAHFNQKAHFNHTAHLNQTSNTADIDTLVLAHVIFRHGDRTPDDYGLWKSNPYYDERFYEPYGYGQLTNEGKSREYNLGSALRRRYGPFLGNNWNTKIYDAWTTDSNRTKMSTSLVLAGLFPPVDPLVWNRALLWQPIPYNYLPVPQDKTLSSWACSTVLPLIYGDESNMRRLRAYDGLIEDLRRGTNEDVDYISALDLYFTMLIQAQLGFPLPFWTRAVYPEPLKSYVVDFYYIETSTNELKTVIAGYLLKKILNDSLNKINGTLNPQERKIFLYSGHEVNIATVLTSLEVFNLRDPPPYSSHLMFEVHRINGIYGIKMFYENYEGNQPHPLTLPGCQEFCPIDQFVRLTANIIPKSDTECLGEQ